MLSGALLSLTAEGGGKFRRKIQINHKVGPGKAHQVIFEVKQPPKIVLTRPVRQLSRLVDGVGGSIAVCDHQPSRLVPVSPVLLVGGVAVHGVKRGGGIGVYVIGVRAKIPVQVHPNQHGGVLIVPGKGQLPYRPAPLLQGLHQELGLGGLAGAVSALKNNELSLHFRFPLSPVTWTRNRGSFIMRPMRLGSLQSR